MVMNLSISVVIPTLNAGKRLKDLLEKIGQQTVRVDEVLIVDSSSSDETTQIAQSCGATAIVIPQSQFDHGRTRDMALRRIHSDVVLFMTQDALPTDEYLIESILAPFADLQVAAVGGRQIAYPDARLYEKLVRAHNYPETEIIWSAEDIDRLGVNAFRISDVCAAYRRKAYLEVGGFDHPILTNEDMLMAEKLLSAGYKLAYSSKAKVFHSHQFTFRQEYRRNYAIGRTLKKYEKRFRHVSELGTGTRLVKRVVLELLCKGKIVECFWFVVNCAARFLGNRMGRYDEGRVSNEGKN